MSLRLLFLVPPVMQIQLLTQLLVLEDQQLVLVLVRLMFMSQQFPRNTMLLKTLNPQIKVLLLLIATISVALPCSLMPPLVMVAFPLQTFTKYSLQLLPDIPIVHLLIQAVMTKTVK
jgi:hypothetical protein